MIDSDIPGGKVLAPNLLEVRTQKKNFFAFFAFFTVAFLWFTMFIIFLKMTFILCIVYVITGFSVRWKGHG